MPGRCGGRLRLFVLQVGVSIFGAITGALTYYSLGMEFIIEVGYIRGGVTAPPPGALLVNLSMAKVFPRTQTPKLRSLLTPTVFTDLIKKNI